MAHRRGAPVLALAAAVLVAGCAGVFRSYDVAPSGLTRYDDGLRRLLTQSRFDSALVVVSPRRAQVGDELLRLQYEGLVAHYAGRWEESNAALQEAHRMAEDRYTRSLTRAAFSLLTSDRVLPYRPPTTERLLLHYYGSLNYLRLGDPEGAAVEARRLSQLLDLDGVEAGDTGRPNPLEATLRYVAAVTFEAAGEWNDAAVAYRLAARALGEPAGEPADSARPNDSVWALAENVMEGTDPLPTDSGEVVLVVERGFAPHRVARSVNVLLWPEEVRTLRAATADAGGEAAEPLARLAAQLVAQREAGVDLSARPDPSPPPPRFPFPVGHAPGRGVHEGTGGPALLSPPTTARADSSRRRATGTPYLLRVSWPELVGSIGRPPPRLRLAGDTSRALPLRSDIAASVSADFERQQPLILAKSLVRALTKYAVARKVEDQLKEEDEVLGEIAGAVANAGLSLLEQADTRSWHLVPSEIYVIRLRLPAGPQPLSLELPPQGFRTGRSIDAGTIEVPEGGLAVLSVRAWQ